MCVGALDQVARQGKVNHLMFGDQGGAGWCLAAMMEALRDSLNQDLMPRTFVIPGQCATSSLPLPEAFDRNENAEVPRSIASASL